jgi:hypothetical protein
MRSKWRVWGPQTGTRCEYLPVRSTTAWPRPASRPVPGLTFSLLSTVPVRGPRTRCKESLCVLCVSAVKMVLMDKHCLHFYLDKVYSRAGFKAH